MNFGGRAAIETRLGTSTPAADAMIAISPCQECGACCAHSSEWPRFSLETDADLMLLPEHLVSASLGGMRCDGNRCCALLGEIATWTSCSIYDRRPLVCRDCQPGDDACSIARTSVGLPVLPARA